MTSCDFQPNVFLPSPHLLVLSPLGAISRSFKGSSYSSSIKAWDLQTSGQGQGGNLDLGLVEVLSLSKSLHH